MNKPKIQKKFDAAARAAEAREAAISDPPAQVMDASEALARLDERYRAAKEEADRLREQTRAADEEIAHLREQHRKDDEAVARLEAQCIRLQDMIHELEGARDAKDACNYALGALRKKPLFGLVPRFIRDEERAREILEAIGRYNDAGEPVPVNWIWELEQKLRTKEPDDGRFPGPCKEPKLPEEVKQ